MTNSFRIVVGARVIENRYSARFQKLTSLLDVRALIHFLAVEDDLVF